MAGRKPWSTLIDKMSPERRADYESAVKQQRIGRLVAQMRKHSGLTQEELAQRLGITQPRLSSMESSEGMQVATFKKIIDELGGQIVVHMPEGDISLTQLVED